MNEGSSRQTLSECILSTLLYYDIFSYPLTPDEVYRFLPSNGVSQEDVGRELQFLHSQSLVFRFGNLFSVQNNQEVFHRRLKGNVLAGATMSKAKKRAILIARFPFIRSVMVSGSLSKGFMDDKSDIDFFIVTQPGRLWIARTLLVVFKRIFLSNSHKYFCVNYLVDSGHLEIDEKNLFTATELATLIPMVNPALYIELLSRNRWLKSFFPNYTARPVGEAASEKGSTLKRILEQFLNVVAGKKVEEYLKATTYRRWKRLYAKSINASDFDVAFKSTEHTSKGHPQNFQRKVLELYRRKLESFPYLKETAQV